MRFFAVALLYAGMSIARTGEMPARTHLQLCAPGMVLRSSGSTTQFRRPLFLNSNETPGDVKGDICALVKHPFATVSAELDGKGSISTQSGVLKDAQYGFNTRFADGSGTNPEELIAAAHAGCSTMALSAKLGDAGMTAESLKTSARVTLDKVEGGFAITAVHLDLVAKIPGASQQTFDAVTDDAKRNCPVSKLLNAKITLNARLES